MIESSTLDTLNLTRPDGEWGVTILFSSSSGIAGVGNVDSDTAAADEISLSLESDATSSGVGLGNATAITAGLSLVTSNADNP